MDSEDESMDNWAEDFCAPPITQQKLDEIRTRAGNVSSSEVEDLVGEIKFLRWLVGALVMRLEYVEDKLGTDLSVDNPESFSVRYGRFIVSSWN